MSRRLFSAHHSEHNGRKYLFARKRKLLQLTLLTFGALLLICVIHFATHSFDLQSISLKPRKFRSTNTLSSTDFSSERDFIFNNGGCNNIQTYLHDPKYQRQNACFVMLTQNEDLEGVLTSIESIELKFNQWFQYPYVLLNDKPFSDAFKKTLQSHTQAKVEFGLIDEVQWEFPQSSSDPEFESDFKMQEDRGILYGGLKSYHKMCRYYSGMFYKHHLVSKYKWYWRIEPDVKFFCSITYDPFYEMMKNNKKYGFTVILTEAYKTMPSLFKKTLDFMKHYKDSVDSHFKVGSSWSMFVDDYNYLHADDETDEALSYLNTFVNYEHNVYEKLHSLMEKRYFIDHYLSKKEDSLKNPQPIENGIKAIIGQATLKPPVFQTKSANQDYNMCHFWSNFEIARLDTFDNPLYNAYFKYLDSQGGFYKERWGDAVVHTLGVAMLNKEDIHYFRDIGYQHSDLFHCPKNKHGKQFNNPFSESFQKQVLPKYKRKSKIIRFFKKVLLSTFQETESPAGIGCQCECPLFRGDVEDADSRCSRQYFTHQSNDYQPRSRYSLEGSLAFLQKEYTESQDV